MPRQSIERKDRSSLDYTNPSQVGREVHASQNVQVKQGRDVSGILNALDRVGEHARKRKEERDEELFARARLDGAAGNTDPELYAQSKVYRQGIDESETQVSMIARYNDARTEFTRLVNTPGFNYAEWRERTVARMAEGMESKEQRKVATNHIMRFMETFDAQNATHEGKELLQRASTATYGLVSELVRGDDPLMSRDPVEARRHINDAMLTGRRNGLDEDEVTRAVALPVIAAIRSGKVEYADVIRDLVEHDPDLADRFDAALKYGEEQKRSELLKDDVDGFMKLEDLIYEERLTPETGKEMIASGHIRDAKELANLLDRQRRLRDERLEKLRKENEKREQELFLRRLISDGNVRQLDTDQRNDALKLMDEEFSALSVMFAYSGDPRLIGKVRESFDRHRANGAFPASLKNQIESVDFSNITAHTGILKLAHTLWTGTDQGEVEGVKLAGGMNQQDYMRTHLSAGALAKLEDYARVVQLSGGNEEAAVQTLQGRVVLTPQQAQDTVRSRPVYQHRDKLLKEFDLNPLAQAEIDTMAEHFIRFNQTPAIAAYDKAAELFRSRTIRLDGNPIRRTEKMGNEFPDRAKTFLRYGLGPAYSLGSDNDLALFQPDPNKPEEFIVYDAMGSVLFGKYEDGKFVSGSEKLILTVDDIDAGSKQAMQRRMEHVASQKLDVQQARAQDRLNNLAQGGGLTTPTQDPQMRRGQDAMGDAMRKLAEQNPTPRRGIDKRKDR
jgi:hypothetical protein